MKSTIDSIELRDAVKIAQLWVPSHSVLEASMRFLLELGDGHLAITATDGVSTFVTLYVPLGEQGEEFRTSVQAKPFTGIVSALAKKDKELTFSYKKRLVVSMGSSRTVMSTFDPDEFITVDRDVGEAAYSISGSDLSKALHFVSDCSSPKAAHPALTGVFLGDNAAVAADGVRIAKMGIDFFDPGVIVPVASVMNISKAVDGEAIDVYVDEQRMVIQWANGIASTSLIGYEFVDYKSLIPSETEYEIPIDRVSFHHAAKLAGGFAVESNDLILLEFSNNKLLVKAWGSSGEHTSTFDVEADFDLSVGVSSKYLLSALSKFTDDLIFMIEDEKHIFGMTSSNGQFYGIMPMRVT